MNSKFNFIFLNKLNVKIIITIVSEFLLCSAILNLQMIFNNCEMFLCEFKHNLPICRNEPNYPCMGIKYWVQSNLCTTATHRTPLLRGGRYSEVPSKKLIWDAWGSSWSLIGGVRSHRFDCIRLQDCYLVNWGLNHIMFTFFKVTRM